MRNSLHRLALLVPFALLAFTSDASAQWRYPRPYPPYGSFRYLGPESHLRLSVTPKQADVYIDGYFAGKVDDFDGALQRLHVRPGEHELTIYLEGYRSLTQRLYLSPGITRTIDGRLEPLQAGELQDPQPTPAEDDREFEEPADEAYRRPPMRGPISPREPADEPGTRQLPPTRPDDTRTASRYASLSIRVQPAGAVVRIDGERWDGPEGDERLIVQVAEGRHLLEVERDGYEPYSREIDVQGGETAPVNISLRRQR